jgi:predicted nucleic acid-binding protein
MILADTSIWIDHLRARDAMLAKLLGAGLILMHPFVMGELALGALRERNTVLRELAELPQARVAFDDEVLRFIEMRKLFGRGLGYVDTHLLAAARLTDGAVLWTRDKRLHLAAAELLLAFEPG